MTGRNIVNAMKTRKMPLARKRPKYMRDLPDGTLLVEDWKLPGYTAYYSSTEKVPSKSILATEFRRKKKLNIKHYYPHQMN